MQTCSCRHLRKHRAHHESARLLALLNANDQEQVHGIEGMLAQKHECMLIRKCASHISGIHYSSIPFSIRAVTAAEPHDGTTQGKQTAAALMRRCQSWKWPGALPFPPALDCCNMPRCSMPISSALCPLPILLPFAFPDLRVVQTSSPKC